MSDQVDLFKGDPLKGWEEERCPSCGARIFWANITKQDGERGRVPLDPKPPVYVVKRDHEGKRVPQKREDDRRVMVSHFATCKRPPKKKDPGLQPKRGS